MAKNTSKRLKINQDVREQRMKEVEEDIDDVTSHIAFKEKRLKEAESFKDYKLCDRITEEIIECKCRKREFEKEAKLLNQKDKKAKKRLETLQNKLIRSSTPMSSSTCSSNISITPPSFVSPTSVACNSDKEQTSSELVNVTESDGDSVSSVMLGNDELENSEKTQHCETNSHF